MSSGWLQYHIEAVVLLQVPTLRLDQVKPAEAAASQPQVEITVEPAVRAAEPSQPALQPSSKPHVPQLIFLPEKVALLS